MSFRVLFLAHAPDADLNKHWSRIDTGHYILNTVVVRTQNEAVQVSKNFVREEHIDSILLCPGFTHADVAEIAEAVHGDVAVAVARGDGPSGRISLAARNREGYPKT